MQGLINKWIFGGLILSLALGIMYMCINPSSIVPHDDAADYDALGWNLAQGKGYTLDGHTPTAKRPPGYPALIALIYLVSSHNYSSVRLVQIILNVANCLLVFWIARDAYTERVGIIAAYLFAVYPAFIFYTGLLLSETLTTHFLLLTTLLLRNALKKDSKFLSGISGVFLGFCTLCRPTTILYPFFLNAGLLIWKKTRQLFVLGLTFAAAMVLTITPWIVRNYASFGRFIPVSALSGYSLLLGTMPRDLSHEDGLLEDPHMVDPAMDNKALQQGIQNIISDPIHYLLLVPQKLVFFWLPEGLSVVGGINTPQGVLLIFLQLIILAFALAGGRQIVEPNEALVFFSLILYYASVHMVLLSTPRFNLPVMPYVLILGSVGAVSLFDRRERHPSTRISSRAGR